MDTSPNLCQKCGKPLPGTALVCPSCGTPKPGAYFFTPESGGDEAGRKKSGRGLRFWFGLVLLIGGSLAACVSLAAMAITLLGMVQGTGSSVALDELTATQTLPAATQTIPVISPTVLTATLTPTLATITSTSIPPGIVTMTPTLAQPTQTTTPVSLANAEPATYSDDFEDVESGWERNLGEGYNLDYAPEGNYRIELSIPDKMAVSVPPYPFEHPMYNMVVSVRAKGEGGNGFYGLLCHLQDGKSYYRAGISNGFYTIHKVINNQLTQLTDPAWKEIISYQPDADGYVTITLACLDGRIQLLIDDFGQEIITDTDLNEGDGAIFVWAGNQSDSEGVYMRGYFDNFSAELP